MARRIETVPDSIAPFSIRRDGDGAVVVANFDGARLTRSQHRRLRRKAQRNAVSIHQFECRTYKASDVGSYLQDAAPKGYTPKHKKDAPFCQRASAVASVLGTHNDLRLQLTGALEGAR